MESKEYKKPEATVTQYEPINLLAASDGLRAARGNYENGLWNSNNFGISSGHGPYDSENWSSSGGSGVASGRQDYGSDTW